MQCHNLHTRTIPKRYAICNPFGRIEQDKNQIDSMRMDVREIREKTLREEITKAGGVAAFVQGTDLSAVYIRNILNKAKNQSGKTRTITGKFARKIEKSKGWQKGYLDGWETFTAEISGKPPTSVINADLVAVIFEAFKSKGIDSRQMDSVKIAQYFSYIYQDMATDLKKGKEIEEIKRDLDLDKIVNQVAIIA